MPNKDSFTGGCLCGAVRYEATGEPTNSLLCHCRMCQRASGSPVTAMLFMAADHVAVTKGQTRTLGFSPRTYRHICDTCGAPIFFSRESRPDIRGIYVGSLDDPNRFRPRLHVCMSSAMEWLDIRDDAPRYAEKPEGMSQTLRYDPASGQSEIPG